MIAHHMDVLLTLGQVLCENSEWSNTPQTYLHGSLCFNSA